MASVTLKQIQADSSLQDKFLFGFIEITGEDLKEAQYLGFNFNVVLEKIMLLAANAEMANFLKVLVIHAAINGNKQVDKLKKYDPKYVAKVTTAMERLAVKAKAIKNDDLTVPRIALVVPIMVLKIRLQLGGSCPVIAAPSKDEIVKLGISEVIANAIVGAKGSKAFCITNACSVIPREAKALFFTMAFNCMKMTIVLCDRTISTADYAQKLQTTLNLCYQQWESNNFDAAYREECLRLCGLEGVRNENATNEGDTKKLLNAFITTTAASWVPTPKRT